MLSDVLRYVLYKEERKMHVIWSRLLSTLATRYSSSFSKIWQSVESAVRNHTCLFAPCVGLLSTLATISVTLPPHHPHWIRHFATVSWRGQEVDSHLKVLPLAGRRPCLTQSLCCCLYKQAKGTYTILDVYVTLQQFCHWHWPKLFMSRFTNAWPKFS